MLRTFLNAMLSLVNTAAAHGGEVHQSSSYSVAKTFNFTFDPTLIVFALVAALYARGLYLYRGKAPVADWQKVLFFLGVLILACGYLPPIDTLADQFFSFHMVQHLLITLIGIPFLLLGSPFAISARALASDLPKRGVIEVLNFAPARKILSWLEHPLPAILIYEGVFWFWHSPRFYNLALRNDIIHLVEHACMAFAALCIWRIIIDVGRHEKRAATAKLFFVLVLMTLDTALSAALSFSSSVWYAYRDVAMPPGWFTDRLTDQQLGGVLMWVSGGTAWLVVLISIFIRWWLDDQARELRTPIEI